ncbi:TPA: TIGR03751 family conjugal transfer lipoprotein [Klebsiella oxytoca]|nr:TIGR03751 family conjugal transfer lipoprotein [Klebsiella oxytoca]
MNKHIYRSLPAIMAALVMLSGCATSKDEMLPPGEQDMKTLWQSRSGGTQRLMDARAQLRRPVTALPAAEQAAWSRHAENEIRSQFPRLPNPDLVMYIFPHITAGVAPVPGYSTVFPLYTRTWYALPGEGERTEAL